MSRYCPGVPIILVACKSDLRDANNVMLVSKEEGQEMADRIGAWRYVECSAKTRQNIHEVFDFAARAALLRPDKRDKKKCLVQ